MGYIFDYYYMKTIQEYIAQNEYYSKSYITHLFKEVGASSFKDMLDYVRIFKSEEMLLNSDLSINEISDRCGFSDIKYYTANFKKWYLCTPSEYRKNAIHDINTKSIFNNLDSKQIVYRINGLTKGERGDAQYRAAVNPLSVKAFGMVVHETHPSEQVLPLAEDMLLDPKIRPRDLKHYMLLRLDLPMIQKSNEELVAYIESYDSSGFMPMLAIDFREISDNKGREAIAKCMEVFMAKQLAGREIYLVYSDLGKYSYINKLIAEAKDKYNFDRIRPLFMG
jgi:AraC-like DNA-binding protein